MIISIHIAKTAGSSFRVAMTETLGLGRLHLDYDDDIGDPNNIFHTDPVAWRRKADAYIATIPPEAQVIHGHLSADKYFGRNAQPGTDYLGPSSV